MTSSWMLAAFQFALSSHDLLYGAGIQLPDRKQYQIDIGHMLIRCRLRRIDIGPISIPLILLQIKGCAVSFGRGLKVS